MTTNQNASNVGTSNVSNKGSVMKEKVVIFKLSMYMDMPSLLKVGYQRDEITELFLACHKAGLGIYSPGTKGRGKKATFTMLSEDFPSTMTLTFQVEKLHREYAGKPGTIPVQVTPIPVQSTTAATLNPTFAGEEPAPQGSFTYSLTLDEKGTVRVARPLFGGKASIEGALKEVWGSIEGRVTEKGNENMSPLEAVASALRGVGFYQLTDASAPVAAAVVAPVAAPAVAASPVVDVPVAAPGAALPPDSLDFGGISGL